MLWQNNNFLLFVKPPSLTKRGWGRFKSLNVAIKNKDTANIFKSPSIPLFLRGKILDTFFKLNTFWLLANLKKQSTPPHFYMVFHS